MPNSLTPEPAGATRKSLAEHVRHNAANLRPDIDHPSHANNGEISNLHPQSPATFSKGIPHDKFGIAEPEAQKRFVDYINQARPNGEFALPDKSGKDVVLGPQNAAGAVRPAGYTPDAGHDTMDAFNDTGSNVRGWESPLAGHSYALQGPDPDAITMPAAPKIGSGELTAEMAEVYGLALLRDFPFSAIETGGAAPVQQDGAPATAQEVFDALDQLSFWSTPQTDPYAERRRRARLAPQQDIFTPTPGGNLTPKAAYRGSTPGAKAGPYLSQFMLIGNAARDPDGAGERSFANARGKSAEQTSGAFNLRPMLAVEPTARDGRQSGTAQQTRKADDGYILFGSQEINQRVVPHKTGKDYMADWASWIDVQNGADYKNRDDFEGGRFITTPRDLASYVHFDALYQAYLNAALLMIGYGHAFDSGLPGGKDDKIRDAFATFGVPHVLSLLTEVASRALKFARRQKFNIHLRARPEAIAGVVTLAAHGAHADQLGAAKADAQQMFNDLHHSDLLGMVNERNKSISGNHSGTDEWIEADKNYLLPMAFPEGSPMHPSYAAGHATVAGACVTIIKAFFEMFEENSWDEIPFRSLYGGNESELFRQSVTTGIFEAAEDGESLTQVPASRLGSDNITIQGELDKLAANISIARNMAGVHYYSDYYDSLRMGERIAVGILQEQMLTYPEKVSMKLKTFDGEKMEIVGHGDGQSVDVNVNGGFKDWFMRAAPGAITPTNNPHAHTRELEPVS